MRYLSRLQLAPDAGKNPAYTRMVFNEYGLHQLVWTLFSDGSKRERDFLYRLEDATGRFSLFTLSARPPEDRHGLFRIQTREFSPQLREGDRLGFKLRANPTIARKREGRRSSRHDVVMDAKRQQRESGERTPGPRLIQEAGLRWLASRQERLGCVFDEASVRADGYRQHRLRPRSPSRQISYSSLDYEGILEVKEPEAFLNSLFSGVGPQRAFGCGLMLLRRV